MRQKTTTITIRISPQEKKQLLDKCSTLNKKAFRKSNISSSKLTRAIIRWYLNYHGLMDDELLTEMKESSRQLSKLGANLNQLASAYNAGLLKEPLDVGSFFKDVHETVGQVSRLQKQMIQTAVDGLPVKFSELEESDAF